MLIHKKKIIYLYFNFILLHVDYKTLENFKRQCFSSMHPYNLAFFK